MGVACVDDVAIVEKSQLFDKGHRWCCIASLETQKSFFFVNISVFQFKIVQYLGKETLEQGLEWISGYND